MELLYELYSVLAGAGLFAAGGVAQGALCCWRSSAGADHEYSIALHCIHTSRIQTQEYVPKPAAPP